MPQSIANRIKVSLIKGDGTNIFKGKGIFDVSRAKTKETRWTLTGRKTDIYFTRPQDLQVEWGRNNKKPKRGIFIIDLKTNRSVDPKTMTATDLDGMTKNFMNHLSEESFWKGYGKKELKKWDKIAYMLAGMGLFFVITQVISIIFGRIL